MKRSPIARRTPIERGGKLPQRRAGKARRTRHVMDLPRRDGEEFVEARQEELGEPVRRGPQAERCKSVKCCICWVLYLERTNPIELRLGNDGIYHPDWRLLPDVPKGCSVPHHEPEGIHATDNKTGPLCVAHHTGPSFVARHPGGPLRFWGFYKVDPREVIAEMRRRVRESDG